LPQRHFFSASIFAGLSPSKALHDAMLYAQAARQTIALGIMNPTHRLAYFFSFVDNGSH
jgi:hypothetical protein